MVLKCIISDLAPVLCNSCVDFSFDIICALKSEICAKREPGICPIENENYIEGQT